MKYKINKIFYLLTFLILALVSLNCASIIHGNKQLIPISSNPTGAQVTVDGQMYYTSPCQVELEREKPYIVTLTLDGYQTEQIKLERGFSNWFYIGVIPGLIFPGPIYDLTSGSAYELSPVSISVTMKKLKTR
jgi:hypothetical protein